MVVLGFARFLQPDQDRAPCACAHNNDDALPITQKTSTEELSLKAESVQRAQGVTVKVVNHSSELPVALRQPTTRSVLTPPTVVSIN